MNVHRWPILITSLLLATNLVGCASFGLFGAPVKPLTITTRPLDKTPLALPDPPPLSLKSFRWRVITPDNADAVWERLAKEDEDVVVFAITADGYQQLAVTIAELRNLIATQRLMIKQYKDYYEPVRKDNK